MWLTFVASGTLQVWDKQIESVCNTVSSIVEKIKEKHPEFTVA